MEGANDGMSTVLSVTDLRLRRGTRDVLRGVTLEVPRGEVVALMGLSGSGKTTVLRAVAGLEPFDSGSVQVNDAALAPGPSRSGDLRVLRQHVGMVFQFHCLFDHLTALDNVCLAPVHVQRRSHHDVRAQAQRLLDDLGVGARAGALPRELSGGEAQRVAIARALAIDPPLLLLDEPTASLDPARRGDLGATLRELAAAGRGLLVTCHDVTFVREFATSCAVLADGVVVECGAPARILDSPGHDATRALLKRD